MNEIVDFSRKLINLFTKKIIGDFGTTEVLVIIKSYILKFLLY